MKTFSYIGIVGIAVIYMQPVQAQSCFGIPDSNFQVCPTETTEYAGLSVRPERA